MEFIPARTKHFTPLLTSIQAPENGRYVRGEILHGVFHIKPADDKKHSEFTMVSMPLARSAFCLFSNYCSSMELVLTLWALFMTSR